MRGRTEIRETNGLRMAQIMIKPPEANPPPGAFSNFCNRYSLATPLSRAACATALPTAIPTFLSSGLGMM